MIEWYISVLVVVFCVECVLCVQMKWLSMSIIFLKKRDMNLPWKETKRTSSKSWTCGTVTWRRCFSCQHLHYYTLTLIWPCAQTCSDFTLKSIEIKTHGGLFSASYSSETSQIKCHFFIRRVKDLISLGRTSLWLMSFASPSSLFFHVWGE